MTWPDGEMLTAVRRCLSGQGPHSSWDFVAAVLVDGSVRVFFHLRDPARREPGLLAVDYSLAHRTEGPNTGEECETPGDWADEVWIDMEEQIETGGLRRAARSIGPDGTALLSWQLS